jgi:hypothetical protein
MGDWANLSIDDDDDDHPVHKEMMGYFGVSLSSSKFFLQLFSLFPSF